MKNETKNNESEPSPESPAATENESNVAASDQDATRPNTSAPEAPVENETGPVPVPESDSASLELKLQEETAKAASHWDMLLRIKADFENYKKRVARERAETAKYAPIPLVQSLLTVLDNFEIALGAAQQATDENAQSFKTGIGMILQQLKSALKEAGVTEVDAQNQVFDPNLHEAVMQQESVDVPEDQVIQQLRKGYKLHDRLLRPASVIVAKAPADPTPAADPSSSETASV